MLECESAGVRVCACVRVCVCLGVCVCVCASVKHHGSSKVWMRSLWHTQWRNTRDMKLFPIFLPRLRNNRGSSSGSSNNNGGERSFMFFFVVELALVWQLWGIFLAQQLLNTGAPPPSQWGAEMEVNFKPYKRCHKLHLMALRAALTAGPPLKRDPRQQHIDIYFSAAAAAATLKKEKLNGH